jgi:hypothetical protein
MTQLKKIVGFGLSMCVTFDFHAPFTKLQLTVWYSRIDLGRFGWSITSGNTSPTELNSELPWWKLCI